MLSSFLPINSKFESPTPYKKKGARGVPIWAENQSRQRDNETTKGKEVPERA
jgi:hypothetical protein